MAARGKLEVEEDQLTPYISMEMCAVRWRVIENLEDISRTVGIYTDNGYMNDSWVHAKANCQRWEKTMRLNDVVCMTCTYTVQVQ